MGFSMQLIRLFICISVLALKLCSAGLVIETSELDESRLVEVSIDILESCYGDRFSTVGLAGPSAGRIMTMMSLRGTMISTTLIDETSTVENDDPFDRGSLYKLWVFVITTTNTSALVKTLEQVEESKWWNHMASFLLIGWPDVENGCSNAYEILWEAWKMDLLNSKFVCLHRTRGHLIYTFNPYTSKAPGPWQQEGTYEGMNGHIWTLFAREYRAEESLCDRLDFDKTVDLGGYEIRAFVTGMEKWFTDLDEQSDLVYRISEITTEILMSSLNATWKLVKVPINGSGTVITETGIAYDWFNATDSGFTDITLNAVFGTFLKDFETTHSYHQDHLAILTQYPGHKSQLEKIISVLDRSSRFGVIVVFMITFLFFKFWLGKPLIPSILNLVLLLCNASLPTIPERLASRIYLTTLFMFVVTIQGIYQGQFAALMTQEVRLPAINTFEELARSNHKIYTMPAYGIFFKESTFEGRYFKSSLGNCIENVLKDPNAACVAMSSALITSAAKHELHLSREPIGVFFEVLLIRPDWPLEERVNEIFRRALAGGIVEKLYSGLRDREMNKIKTYEEREAEPVPKVIVLENLKFAFVMLGIGLACATIIFLIELAFFAATTRNPPNRDRRRVNSRNRIRR